METLIMPVKPGQISEQDKVKLESAGIIVIETDQPETIRLVSPTLVIQGNRILSELLQKVSKWNGPIKSEVCDIFINAFVTAESD